MTHPERKRTGLETALANLQARWGVRIVRKLGKPETVTVPHLETGFATLDRALGIGGLPRGHVSELVGAPTSGAGTVALKTLANAHYIGEMTVYLDLSGTFDADYAVRCGVRLANLLLVRPTSDAEAFDIAYTLVSSGSVGALIYDAGAEMYLSVVWRLLLAPLANSACAFIYLSESATAESAAVRLYIERERWLYRRRDVRGYRARVTILENKFSALRNPVSVLIGFSGAVAGDGV